MYAACVGETWPLHSLFLLVLTSLAVQAQTCEELQCLNSNPCQSVSTHDNSTRGRCICGGKWAGRRCEHLIHVKPTSVTSSNVKLKVGFAAASNKMASQGGSSALSLVSSEEEQKIELNYTLVFWKRNDSSFPFFTSDSSPSLLSSATSGEVTCVLLHGRQSRTPTVGGLVPRTRYTLCVENGFVDSCYLSSFADPSSSSSSLLSSSRSPHWPSNCVTIFTTSSELSPTVVTTSTTVTVVAAVSTFILIVLIIVFVVFLLMRQSVAVRLFVEDVVCCCGCCHRCCPKGTCNSGGEEGTYLGQPSAEMGRTYSLRGDSATRGNSMFGRALLERFRNGRRKRQTQSSNTFVHFSSPSSSLTAAFNNRCPAGEDEAESSTLQDIDSEIDPAGVALVTTTVAVVGQCKPRHRLSRKRRGYVTYNTRKDRSVKLTTVLETPLDEMASTGLMTVDEGGTLSPPDGIETVLDDTYTVLPPQVTTVPQQTVTVLPPEDSEFIPGDVEMIS